MNMLHNERVFGSIPFYSDLSLSLGTSNTRNTLSEIWLGGLKERLLNKSKSNISHYRGV